MKARKPGRAAIMALLEVGDSYAFLAPEGISGEYLNRILQADMRHMRKKGITAVFECETGRIVRPKTDILLHVCIVTRTA